MEMRRNCAERYKQPPKVSNLGINPSSVIKQETCNYLHCFELWHKKIGEEEKAETEEEWVSKNRHKLVWSSWCGGDYGVSTWMKQGFGLIFKRFGWNFLLIEEESSDQTS